MKIKNVEIFKMYCKDAFGWAPIGCRVHTDEDIYGDGEAALGYGIGSSAAFGMIKDLSSLVIGMNPMDTEVIWDKLYKTTFWGQNGGPVVFAGISALDTALWDIKGKALNLPLYSMLGGKKRDKLRTYASQIQGGFGPVHEWQKSPEDYANISKKCVALGYDAVKIDFLSVAPDGSFLTNEMRKGLLLPYYLHLIEDRVAAVREAIGPEVDIIVENHSNLDALSAVQVAQAIEKYRIFFFEEPNTPTPKTLKYIADKTSIPIANGERIYSRWQYAPYFENMSIQVAQPDIGTCGGITEAKKICDMAYVYDVAIQAHVCASPLGTPVALALEACIPNFCIHEHHLVNLHQYNKNLCIHDYQPENGFFSVPDLPGIGNEYSEKAIKEALEYCNVTT